jgi:hypothetical protein
MNTQRIGDVQAPDTHDTITTSEIPAEATMPETAEVEGQVEVDLLEENRKAIEAMRSRRGLRTQRGESSGKGPGRVRLAKSQQDKALPQGPVNIGMTTINIPDKAQQLKGWVAEDAGVLVAQYRQYKFAEDKGKPTTQNITL